MCLAIMACAVCRKKVLGKSPKCLGGNLGDSGGDFAKVSTCQGISQFFKNLLINKSMNTVLFAIAFAIMPTSAL